MSKIWKIVGVKFDHMHMGDLLRQAYEHPSVEIAGICDEKPQRMEEAIANFKIDPERVYQDVDTCLRESQPDIVIICAATALHADYVERVAPYGVHILVEKPFASTLAEADRMIAAMPKNKQLIINWPLRWYASHITSKRLIDERLIGEVIQIHYYDGNRGPIRHGADKKEKLTGKKNESWFYHRDQGGGSLLDYLGYGVTLGTWFNGGQSPIEVTATVDRPEGLEVDEHSIVVARYASGLSKFETCWGTFTDPWTHQPQPKCGFVIVGTEGTISSYDYEKTVRVQTEACPEGYEQAVDEVTFPHRNPIEHFVDCLNCGRSVDSALCTEIARIGQQIVDIAYRSAEEKRTLPFAE